MYDPRGMTFDVNYRLLIIDRDWEMDFLAFRFWVGAWIGLILLVFVALDLSSLAQYITRFTEECFSTLIF